MKLCWKKVWFRELGCPSTLSKAQNQKNQNLLCVWYYYFCRFILLFNLFLLLFMDFTALFGTINEFYYTILVTFYNINDIFSEKFSVSTK